MMTLFNQDTIMRIHDYNVEKKGLEKGMQEGLYKGRQEGMQEGRREGRQEGIEKGIRALITSMRKFAIDKETVLQQVIDQFGLSEALAKEKIEKYWI